MSNLAQRILTAVVLAAVLLAALYAGVWPFVLLALLMIGAAGWEWARLIGCTGWRAWASGLACVACAVGFTVLLVLVLAWTDKHQARSMGLAVQAGVGGAVCLLWVAGGVWLLRGGVAHWLALPRWLRWGIGMAMLSVAWFALVVGSLWGGKFLFSVLTLAWAADIGGYVFGRALGGKLTGGRKLAPSISPGKTWEGAVGGFLCVTLLGAVWVWWEHPQLYQSWTPTSAGLYSVLWLRGPVWFVAGLAFLTVMSIVGDLTESLVKRAAGAKDSSGLLPGHGGVLDRIDALLPVLPLAVIMVWLPMVFIMYLSTPQ